MNSAFISGLGIVSPAGCDEESFGRSVRDGFCPITPLPEARVPEGQKAVGAPISSDKVAEGRATRMLQQACEQALKNAGLSEGIDCAILVGTSLGDIDSALAHHKKQIDGESDGNILPFQPENLARHLAKELKLQGPHVTMSCACTSGTSALGMALDWIRLGRAKRCLVCAVDSLNDFVLCGFSSLWALTSDTPRPFDTARTGMALGETAAAFIVESEELLTERKDKVRAKLSGYGASGDAVHITAPDRKGGGAQRALEQAIGDATWSPEQVDYLNVHATGSLYNDSMILAATRTVFGDHALKLPISSVNPCTGHTLGAAGLAEAVATLLAMEQNYIPPTPNLLAPEVDDLQLVRDGALESSVRRAVSLTTGFGGANTAIALELPGGDQ